MRIFSDFHDYYDTALGFGIDPTCTYTRKTDQRFPSRIPHEKGSTEFDAMRDIFDHNFSQSSWTYRSRFLPQRFTMIESFFVIFCGRVHPGLRVQIDTREAGKLIYSDEHFFCYTVDHLRDVVKRWGTEDEQKVFEQQSVRRKSHPTDSIRTSLRESRRYNRHGQFTADWAKRFFTVRPEIEKKTNAFQIEHRIPVMVFKEGMLEYHPCLKEYEFFKVLDAFGAFQELSMYISGVLGGTAPEMVEISDADRIHKHGFDKWSFRKPPEKK